MPCVSKDVDRTAWEFITSALHRVMQFYLSYWLVIGYYFQSIDGSRVVYTINNTLALRVVSHFKEFID